ncbi:MAG: hypothetical protein GKS06_18660 [Acidobacteria bacterium]|nr:hypothetical protein [Acidobacteriota bacterium]
MKPTRSVLLAALLAMVIMTFAPVAEAQTQATGGTVQGQVTDPDGNTLPGVTVTVTSNETGRVRTTVSSATGTYRVPLLSPGMYTVRVDLTGFQPMERNDVRVTIGSALDVNMQMGLASVQEVLIVTGEAPLIETSKTQVSTTIDETAIDSLPILGRNFTDFALLTPGAQIEQVRNTVALSGQRGVNTSVNIDGASDNSAFFGYQRGGTDSPFTVSQESVKEFQVITSGIMPEFGRSGGGLLNVVTKSGTNQWRGGAHFFTRNESLVADDPFGNAQSNFDAKQFGGNIGGPIVKNEHFIFASVDAQKFTTPYFVRYTVTPAEQAALDAYIGANRPDWDISQSQFDRTNDVIVPFVKADFGITDNTQLSIRGNYSAHETVGGGTDTNLQGNTFSTQSSLGDQEEKTVSIIGQLTSVLGDRAFNELRVQYGTDNLDRLSNDVMGPDTDVRNPSIQMGRRFFMPIFVNEKKFQVQNNFSYLFDDHDIKVGIDFETDQTGEFFAGFAAGEYRFSGLDNFFNKDTDFLLQSFGVATPNFENNFDARQSVLAFYAQDSWRVNDKLTLNYGLRWEGTFNPDPTGNPDRPQTQQIPNDLSGWQPRAGFAYAASDKTVLRASGGLFTSRTPTLLFFNPFTSVGLPGVGIFFIPSFGPNGAVDGLWPNILPALPSGITAEQEIYWFDPSFQSARTLRINGGLEHEIARDISVGAEYVYARGSNLQTLHDTNLIAGGRDATGRFMYNGRFTNGEQWRISRSNGKSQYHAAIFSLKKRFANGWGGMAHYTFADDKDNDSNERSAGGEQATNIYDLNEDWGYSDRSIKHRVVVTGYGDLPANLKLAGTFTWNTGTPYSANLPFDANGDGETNDRAVINGTVASRNTFRQPDFKNVDLRVSWEARTGAGNFQILLDVFNVFNWQNLFTNETNFTDADFGSLNTFIGNTRQLQLGFKYIY